MDQAVRRSRSLVLRVLGLGFLALGVAAAAVLAGTLLGRFERAGYGQFHLLVLGAVGVLALVPLGLLLWASGAAMSRRQGRPQP